MIDPKKARLVSPDDLTEDEKSGMKCVVFKVCWMEKRQKQCTILVPQDMVVNDVALEENVADLLFLNDQPEFVGRPFDLRTVMRECAVADMQAETYILGADELKKIASKPVKLFL